jgi:phosphopantetheinyl transferase
MSQPLTSGSCQAGAIRFGPREIQIWGIWLTVSDAALAYYCSTLSLDERHRAERFSFANLRRSYTLSRGGLRILLAHYLRCLPNEIELVCGPKANRSFETHRGSDSTLRIQVS